jgi:hypothetical protein
MAEVSHLPHFFMVWCLIIKQKDKFTLTLDAVNLYHLEFITQIDSRHSNDYAELLVNAFLLLRHWGNVHAFVLIKSNITM